MKIDIDGLTEAELIDLNNRICRALEIPESDAGSCPNAGVQDW